MNKIVEQTSSIVTDESTVVDEADHTSASSKQAEQFVKAPSTNDAEVLEANLDLLPCDAPTSTNEENISWSENSSLEDPAAAKADTNLSSSYTEPKTLGSSCKATTTTEDFIATRILTYASQFAKPEYLYPTYEPTCCKHHHVPGRGGHNHSDRPEHLLSKEALVKLAPSLRGLCEARVHLGLGEE